MCYSAPVSIVGSLPPVLARSCACYQGVLVGVVVMTAKTGPLTQAVKCVYFMLLGKHLTAHPEILGSNTSVDRIALILLTP